MTPLPPRPPAAAERGLASLSLGSLLMLGLLVLGGLLLQAQLAELRSGERQLRTLQAREAAEAGLAWARVQLNHPPLAVPGLCPAPGLRDHLLQIPVGTGPLLPQPLHPPPRAACRLDPEGPVCDCPPPASGQLPAVAGSSPGFSVRPQALAASAAAAGAMLLRIEGCSETRPSCLGGSGEEAGARAGLTVGFQARPLLLRLPRAALTAGGRVRLCAPGRLENPEPAAGGLLVHAGLALARPGAAGGLPPCQADLLVCVSPPCPGLLLQGLAGQPVWDTLIGPDAGLATQLASFEALSLHLFGLDMPRLREAPGMVRLASSDATGLLPLRVSQGARRLWVEGPLTLNAPGDLGSATSPLLLVVEGAVHWQGGGRLFGLLVADSLNVAGGPAEAELQGAVLLRGDHEALGPLRVRYDSALLLRLRAQSSLLLPVAGSLRDF